jgi:hypothetical protein
MYFQAATFKILRRNKKNSFSNNIGFGETGLFGTGKVATNGRDEPDAFRRRRK